MGIYVIRVPDIGEGIAEVELVAWHVQPGDAVVEDQHLADVMTDKATVEVPSHVHGKVLALGGNPGQVMAVGAELVRLEVEGAGNLQENEKKAASARATPAAEAPATVATATAKAVPASQPAAPVPAPAPVRSPAPARPAGVARKEGERPLAAPS